MSTPRSAIVANTSLPVSRLSITRPATATATSVSVPGAEVGAELARTSAALWVRSKRYGYGSTPAARSSSTCALAAGPLGGEPAAASAVASAWSPSGTVATVPVTDRAAVGPVVDPVRPPVRIPASAAAVGAVP